VTFSHRHADSDTNGDPHPNRHPDCDEHANSDPDRDSHANGDASCDEHAERDPDGEREFAGTANAPRFAVECAVAGESDAAGGRVGGDLHPDHGSEWELYV
jgi:hypothetical protein